MASSAALSPNIKICGINDPAALEATIKGRATHAGFVFFAKSPRHVTPTQAAELTVRAEGRILRVGLFVDADDATIAQTLAAARLDVLQLHGDETPERAAALKREFRLPVWKAVPVAVRDDLARAARYHGAADLVLFDAKTPKGTLPGGMGLSFDWDILSSWKLPMPWGLAGGLTPENVAGALAATHAPLVDCSSGVETAPGVKDPERIAAFCRTVRG